MSISIKPDPLDRFTRILIDGSLVDVKNPQQDIEFAVYSPDGALLDSGTKKVGLDKALGSLRTYKDRKAVIEKSAKDAAAARMADMLFECYASGETVEIATRFTEDGFEIAEIFDESDLPDPDDLDWREEADMPNLVRPSLGFPI